MASLRRRILNDRVLNMVIVLQTSAICFHSSLGASVRQAREIGLSANISPQSRGSGFNHFEYGIHGGRPVRV